MFIRFREGHECGTCDEYWCGDVYDTRLDRHAGGGMCGRCWRRRYAPELHEPLPVDQTFFRDFVARDTNATLLKTVLRAVAPGQQQQAAFRACNPWG